MRKQTKLVAVLSAAALLAIGASMTSFAAGWQKNDDGSWNYYDSDDEMVTGEWKKDGNKWFYLDDDGVMLTDSWVDDEYYVGEDGAMLINAWKKTIADEDIDDPEDDGEAWYYFGSKGKKTVDSDKKIGGKTYYFDENGKMKDGWQEIGEDNLYYLGDEDDGARKSGWLWLAMPDVEEAEAFGHTENCEDCDEEAWYYFGSDGKAFAGADKKKVNGKYYYFNEHGQMLYEWINNQKVNDVTPGNAVADGSANGAASASDMLYMNVVEEGWRADGWYEIDGAEDTSSSDDTDWYYFKDGKAKRAESSKDIVGGWEKENGSVVRAKIKISGKYFCFNEKGQMKTGLQYIPAAKGFYYFDENGYMKTGKVSNVEEDNNSFTYFFDTKNGNLGKGVMGEKSGYVYFHGKRVEADDDYRVYVVDGKNYLVNKAGKAQKSNKKYDIENEGGTADMEVTFKNKSYEIDKINGKAVAGSGITVSEPSIFLYDGEAKIADVPVK